MDADHTHLLTVFVQVVDGFTGSIGSRAHEDDDAVGIVGTVVREQVIFAAGNLRNLAEVLLNHFGHCIVVGVASLTVCEERLGVLGRTTGDGALGREGTVAETLDVLFLDERTDVFLVHEFNLVILVAGAETIEEVHEWNAGFERCEVSHSRDVHDFLHTAFAQHGKTCLTASHHVLMVAEDAERVAGQCTCADVEDAGNEFAGNLIHVRNHQQQTLRGSERRSERTSLQRTVNGTGSTGFRLHFLHTYGLSPQVLTTAGSPFVNMLRHRRRRSDGVDGCYLREHVTHMSRSLVTITSDKFLFFTHTYIKLCEK